MKITHNGMQRTFEPIMMSDKDFFLEINDHNFQKDFESANKNINSSDPDMVTEWVYWLDNHDNVINTIKQLASLYIDENIG